MTISFSIATVLDFVEILQYIIRKTVIIVQNKNIIVLNAFGSSEREYDYDLLKKTRLSEALPLYILFPEIHARQSCNLDFRVWRRGDEQWINTFFDIKTHLFQSKVQM